MLDLIPLFTTVAQVTFAITGLMFIALAGDSETRFFWFGSNNHARASYAYITLSLVVLPGFLAVGALIVFPSEKINSQIPSWAVSAVIIGFIQLVLILISEIAIRTRDDVREFTRLKKLVTITDIGTYMGAVVNIFLGITGFYPKSEPHITIYFETLLGFSLWLSIITGALLPLQLLRFESDIKVPNKKAEEKPVVLPSMPERYSNSHHVMGRVGLSFGVLALIFFFLLLYPKKR